MPTAPPTHNHVEGFLRHLRDDRQLAPATLRGYRQELLLLVHRKVPLEPEALARHIGRDEQGQALAPATRNRKLVIARAFCRWLVKQGALPTDPTAGIQRSRQPRHEKAALTAAELRQVLAVLRLALLTWRQIRDETILCLLYYTGLRVSELRRLDLGQADLEALVLRATRRKGGHLVDALLTEDAASVLARWLAVRPGTTTSAVFLNGDGQRLSVRSIQKILKAMGQAAGLGDRLHPHAVRHAHATGLLREGVPTATIQRSLNHSSLQTTERYLHADDDLLRKALDKLPKIR